MSSFDDWSKLDEEEEDELQDNASIHPSKYIYGLLSL